MKKMNFLIRGLMAVLIAAFVLRPVVVNVHNGSLLSGARPDSQRHSDCSLTGPLVPAKAAFHNIAKEFKDFTTPSPRLARGMALAVGNLLLRPAATSFHHIPGSLLILRI